MDEELGFAMQIKLLLWAINRVDLSNIFQQFLQTYDVYQTRLMTSNAVAYMWNRRTLGDAQRKLTEEFTQKARPLVDKDGKLLMDMELDLNETLLLIAGIELGRGFDRPSVSEFLAVNTAAKQRLYMLLATIDCELLDGTMSATSYEKLKKAADELLQHVLTSIATSNVGESRRKLEELKRQQTAHRQHVLRKMKKQKELVRFERRQQEAVFREAILNEQRESERRMVAEKMAREQIERDRIRVEEEQRQREKAERETMIANHERELIELDRKRQQQLADIEERARRERTRMNQERVKKEKELKDKEERELLELHSLKEELEVLKQDKKALAEKGAKLMLEPNQVLNDKPIVPEDPLTYIGLLDSSLPNGGGESTTFHGHIPDISTVTQSIQTENCVGEESQDKIETLEAVDIVKSIGSEGTSYSLRRLVFSILQPLLPLSFLPVACSFVRDRRYRLLISLVIATPLLFYVYSGVFYQEPEDNATDGRKTCERLNVIRTFIPPQPTPKQECNRQQFLDLVKFRNSSQEATSHLVEAPRTVRAVENEKKKQVDFDDGTIILTKIF